MIEEIKKRGYKFTPQRLEIIKVLAENADNHPSLNNIYEKVRKKLTTVSFSTLYNTISTLEKIGLIRLFDFRGETRVEVNTDSHINMINNKTGKIIDIVDKQLIDEIAKKLQSEKSKHNLILVNIIMC